MGLVRVSNRATSRPAPAPPAWRGNPGEPQTRHLYESDVGILGEFRCPAGCKAWEVENTIGPMATLAFARDPVAIHQADHDSVIATPNEAMLYNPNQVYRRRVVDPQGDRCEFLGLRAEILAEIVAQHDPRAADDPQRPLKWAWASISSGLYLAQRSLYHHVRAAASDPPTVRLDRLLVDECIISIADSVVALAARAHARPARRAATARDHRVWIEGAKDYLARNFRRSLSLQEVADAVGVSLFHLCRLFKAHAGTTVHDYVRSLRVRAALEGLADPALPIGHVADELGFCNQSHFTRAFRSEYALTPTQVRRALREGIAEQPLLHTPPPDTSN